MLSDKTVLITGGTGSFGTAALKLLLKEGVSCVRILSRDEKKQFDLRNQYADKPVSWYIGDVRDPASLEAAMSDVDYVFHAAALKQVPSCEFFPLEAVKTNVLGTQNVIHIAHNCGVKKVVCLSTDKAVYPVNAMGISKAMMERVALASSRELRDKGIVISATRYGNVMGSRGSVIPTFISQVLKGNPITVTNPMMTRYLMDIQQAVHLVLFSFKWACAGDIFVHKSPATRIGVLAQAVAELFGKEGHPISEIGARHGEKLHETLVTDMELSNAEDMGEFIRIRPDVRKLDYAKYYEEGDVEITKSQLNGPMNSENAEILGLEEVKAKLMKLDFVKSALKTSHIEI